MRIFFMRTAIYPGSFDPVTNGHMDIIRRAAEMVDRLVIGVLNNSTKSPLFSVEERVTMLKKVTEGIPGVEVTYFTGMLIDFAQSCDARIIVRGLRGVSDLEYERSWAQANHSMRPQLDTMFLITDQKYSYISSSMVRELAGYHADIRELVPAYVAEMIAEKTGK